jgi:hypothetical protein
MAKFPVVFLPGSVVQPSAGEANPIKQLTYPQLRALRDSIGGGNINARTPDPQARQIEFKNFLEEGLKRFDQQIPLNDIIHLSQFFALVEGLIFGHLRLKIFDLRVFKFAIPDHLRYMGVLSNHQGHILAGTDPETLFFSASNASPQSFLELQSANTNSRNTNVGVNARRLLHLFKQKLQSVWQPDRVLWMRLLDRLFALGDQQAPIETAGLLEGWKQIGPVTLRINTAAEEVNFRPFYLPVYQENFRTRTLSALSGDVVPVDGGLHLIVDSLPVGRVLLPKPERVGNQELLSLGAGTIETQDGTPISISVNYAQLRSRIQGIVHEAIGDTPHAVNDIVNIAPFEYPDVVRLPAQYDGFVALEQLRLGTAGKFSDRFLSQMKGRALLEAPTSSGVGSSLIREVNGYYFVESNQLGTAFYVEMFHGVRVAELTTLGYILWSIFDKQAVVNTENSVSINYVPVLNFTGFRFDISENIEPAWPDYESKAATLQRLKGTLDTQTGLFKVAVLEWLDRGYHRDIAAQRSNPRSVTIGRREWYIDNY